MLEKYLHYYRPYKAILVGVMLGSCVVAVLDLLFPMIVRHVLNVELPQNNIDTIFMWAGLLLLLYLINFCLVFGISYYGHVMSMGIEHDMRRDIFAHIESLSFRYFDNTRTGQLLSRITSDIVEVSELTFRGPNDVLVCSISMLGSIGIMLYMNPILGGIISVLLLGKTVHAIIINKKMKAAFRKSRAKSGELTARTEESLNGIRLAKTFANEDLELARFMEKSSELKEVRSSSFGILAYFSGVVGLFTNVTNLTVLVCGSVMVAFDRLALSDFVAFFLYVNLFMKPILRLMVFTEIYQRGMAGLNRFYEMLAVKPEIEDAPNAITSVAIKGDIFFDNVTFSYLEGQPVLKDFSLHVKAGEKVAFVGATGAGKTTIANLLLRFYEPQQGSILLDGVDIKNYSQKLLRQQVGLVQQDVFLFSDSVAFNIAYGRMDAASGDIEKAAKEAAAHEFIERLPEGYGTMVGERGVKLSGGQKQRLAIARAFLKNPPVMVFDEATSALDTRTEKQIQGAMNKLAINRTTLIIAHRLSTIEDADRIVVLKDGGIAEIGTHQELLAKNGNYKALYETAKE
ncbi:ABC transporter ATP-binding protein [Phascolarctobacterium sp.]|uniref:ABC transporter ATP-binding protein n=1 Tax=Phascolarctobacterium sp. TaxID=2049039 RepID=UPI003865AA46